MIHREKQTLRAQMKAALREFSGKSTASALVQKHLRQSPFWTAARVVYGFAPLPSEPAWLGEDWPDDKIIAFPRASDAGLAFFTGRDLLPGPLGNHEPAEDAPAPPPDLILVPGLAFDRSGFRLGRGGGFYDRFLEALPFPRPVLCGICFSCQIVPTVPREAHDARVEWVLNEEGLVERSP